MVLNMLVTPHSLFSAHHCNKAVCSEHPLGTASSILQSQQIAFQAASLPTPDVVTLQTLPLKLLSHLRNLSAKHPSRQLPTDILLDLFPDLLGFLGERGLITLLRSL